ncbi:MAG: DNA-binding transcriptional regulator [Phycisphaeraceae bacterium]
MRKPPYEIALVMDKVRTLTRGIIHGVYDYANEERSARRRPWRVRVISPESEAIDQLEQVQFHGVIAFLYRTELLNRVRKLGRPVVNVSRVFEDTGFLHVGVDNHAVGRLAAEHLLERGFTRFAFCGRNPNVAFARAREDGFRGRLQEAGHDCFVWPPADIQVGANSTAHRTQWLKTLPKPVAIMAVYDDMALLLSEACRELGLHVPDEVALVGVDDDDLLTRIAYPALSSVRLPLRKIGTEAARQLDRQISGRKPPVKPVLLPPLGVSVRASSDTVKVSNEHVNKALAVIHRDEGKSITVEDLLKKVPVSRSWLERQFKAVLGRTPYAEIQRVRIERARRLLAHSDMPLHQIAKVCGFGGPIRFSHTFSRETGEPPSAYRRRFRES